MDRFRAIQFIVVCLLGLRVELISTQGDIKKEDKYPHIDAIRYGIDKGGRQADLWTVGTFMAAHKYFGVDLRFQAGEIVPQDQVFYKKFPTPVLREFHPDVQRECELGVTECVEEVLKTALRSGSLKHLFHDDTRELSSPFSSNFEMFQYRQTAAYYLCWFTNRYEKFLKYTSDNQTCLSHLAAVEDIPEEDREHLLTDNLPAINDLRSDASYYQPESGEGKPFTCAELWFCPDPCYGRETRGNYVNITGIKHPGNPCGKLKNDECTWKKHENKNFHDLIRNKFNISCDCHSERSRFEWSSRFSMCVDKDECFDGTDNCPDKWVCKNAVGSFICVCPRGYTISRKTNNCAKIALLHSAAKIAEYKPKTDDDEEGDFISDLMNWVGLSHASISTSKYQLLIASFVCCIAII